MDQRKLIRFGKSAFCITLPHAWVTKNKLLKGDNIGVLETVNNSLEILPTTNAPETSNNLVADITGKSTDEIIQLLLATYLNGYTIVTLEGPNAGKVAFIRKHVQEFIAAEIMEVTTTKIVIHVFWDIKNINMDSIINRITIIIKSMFAETIDLLDTEVNIIDITEKGIEVQRQVLLGRRAIKYALYHPAIAKKFELNSVALLYVSYMIYFFGMTADYIVKIVQIIGNEELNKLLKPKAKTTLKKLLKHALDYFTIVLSTYYKRDNKVTFILSDYQDFESAINEFREKCSHPAASLLSEYIKMLISKIKETQITMISMENAPK